MDFADWMPSSHHLRLYIVLSHVCVSSQATLAKAWAAADIQAKWAKSAWARKLARQNVRASLSDFDRFKLMLARKKVSPIISATSSRISKLRMQFLLLTHFSATVKHSQCISFSFFVLF
jgi:hypothetical protein